jgi:hypothetical protein
MARQILSFELFLVIQSLVLLVQVSLVGLYVDSIDINCLSLQGRTGPPYRLMDDDVPGGQKVIDAIIKLLPCGPVPFVGPVRKTTLQQIVDLPQPLPKGVLFVVHDCRAMGAGAYSKTKQTKKLTVYEGPLGDTKADRAQEGCLRLHVFFGLGMKLDNDGVGVAHGAAPTLIRS